MFKSNEYSLHPDYLNTPYTHTHTHMHAHTHTCTHRHTHTHIHTHIHTYIITPVKSFPPTEVISQGIILLRHGRVPNYKRLLVTESF